MGCCGYLKSIKRWICIKLMKRKQKEKYKKFKDIELISLPRQPVSIICCHTCNYSGGEYIDCPSTCPCKCHIFDYDI